MIPDPDYPDEDMTSTHIEDFLMAGACLGILWLFGFLPFLCFLFTVAVANSVQEYRKTH